MGGYGALLLGAKADVCAIGGHSPALWFHAGDSAAGEVPPGPAPPQPPGRDDGQRQPPGEVLDEHRVGRQAGTVKERRLSTLDEPGNHPGQPERRVEDRDGAEVTGDHPNRCHGREPGRQRIDVDLPHETDRRPQGQPEHRRVERKGPVERGTEQEHHRVVEHVPDGAEPDDPGRHRTPRRPRHRTEQNRHGQHQDDQAGTPRRAVHHRRPAQQPGYEAGDGTGRRGGHRECPGQPISGPAGARYRAGPGRRGQRPTHQFSSGRMSMAPHGHSAAHRPQPLQ